MNKKYSFKNKPTSVSALLLTLGLSLAQADQVVQFPVASILTTRTVTTLTNGKLVTWTPGGGVDGNGGGNGYLTSAASLFHGDKNIIALPDSSLIPADIRHPEIQLHYSNSDGVGFQTRNIKAADTNTFTIPVPGGNYSKIFIIMTSSEGDANLRFTLVYNDSSEIKPVILKDYGTGTTSILPTDPVLFYLVKNMAKWSSTNAVAEQKNHNVDGIELHPIATKILTAVKVKKMGGAPYVVFWGATGIATGPVGINPSPKIINENTSFSSMRLLKSVQGISFANLPNNTELNIYTLNGLKVAHASSLQSQEINWNFKNASNQKVNHGMYICELRSGKATAKLNVLVSE